MYACTCTCLSSLRGLLTLTDVVMIANLLLMVTIGGYEAFVSRLKIDDYPG
ncbi:YqhA family protein [Crenobacter oryzisoli]|uniref:YqhA family protein n=1 Tax=Crenobacter oryzisoli TaxID=3056844 RepID=UPI00320478DC